MSDIDRYLDAATRDNTRRSPVQRVSLHHQHRGDAVSDDGYHHSGIGAATHSETLPQLSQAVITANLDASHLGPKLLTDPAWSALGRFAASHQPADGGAFHTPSLRNVAVTVPYIHDGSIATLSDAVDHEIYYRG